MIRSPAGFAETAFSKRDAALEDQRVWKRWYLLNAGKKP